MTPEWPRMLKIFELKTSSNGDHKNLVTKNFDLIFEPAHILLTLFSRKYDIFDQKYYKKVSVKKSANIMG